MVLIWASLELAPILQVVLELEGLVEVIPDGALVAARDEDDLWSPEATASSTTYWMVGLSTRGSISFGWAFVAGRKRVPSPRRGRRPCGLGSQASPRGGTVRALLRGPGFPADAHLILSF
jgi:hypothetical protein